MRKQWPAKRSRVRLGVGKIEQVPKPKKSQKSEISGKLEKPEVSPTKAKKKVKEKSEEVKEEQPEAEVSEEKPTEKEPEETEEGVQETFGIKEEERVEGTVKFFNPNKGFGFITGDDGKEYYVHQDALKEGVTIETEDKVSFKAVEGDKGPKAEEVEKKEVV